MVGNSFQKKNVLGRKGLLIKEWPQFKRCEQGLILVNPIINVSNRQFGVSFHPRYVVIDFCNDQLGVLHKDLG
jgi:hypothetical protein